MKIIILCYLKCLWCKYYFPVDEIYLSPDSNICRECLPVVLKEAKTGKPEVLNYLIKRRI